MKPRPLLPSLCVCVCLNLSCVPMCASECLCVQLWRAPEGFSICLVRMYAHVPPFSFLFRRGGKGAMHLLSPLLSLSVDRKEEEKRNTPLCCATPTVGKEDEFAVAFPLPLCPWPSPPPPNAPDHYSSFVSFRHSLRVYTLLLSSVAPSPPHSLPPLPASPPSPPPGQWLVWVSVALFVGGGSWNGKARQGGGG